MKYAFCQQRDGITYSLDMLRIKVNISDYRLERFFKFFIEDETKKAVKVYAETYTDFHWKHFATCTYGEKGVVKMGFHMNGVKAENKDMGFIEFNPNSFAECQGFWEDYRYMMGFFRFPELSRFDLAIDIQAERNTVAMIKDNREYSCIRKSQLDFTENLGKRGKVGRVKLYNKQIESNLTYPLTRLEVTGNLESLNIPKVVNLKNMPRTDSQLINAVLRNDNFTLALSDMSQFHRSRIVNIIKDNILIFDETCIDAVVQYAKELVNGKGVII